MQNSSRTQKIVIIGTIWGFIVLLLSVIIEPTPENFTLAASIILSGVYTLILFQTKRFWLPLAQMKPFRNAILVGSLNAVVIESLFLVIEKIFGAEGIAAHPNLLLDLIMTMPWYIGMVWIFVRVQKKNNFSPAAVLLFGAVYELGADGVVGGQIIPITMGEPINLLNSWILMLLLAFWQFIPVYSSMVLPPAWALDAVQPGERESKPNWKQGFLPLLWLIPFTIYLFFLIVIIGSLGI
jgi:hypothetical protein